MNSRGFTSKLGYILSMAAFSIGLGNLWKFPYMVGNNGGGAFLIVYLAAVLFVGLPCFLIEGTLGRSAGSSPIVGMRTLTGKRKTGWSAIGWLGSGTSMLINGLTGVIIGGWTLGYFWKLLTGQLSNITAEAVTQTFSNYVSSWHPLTGTIIALALLLLCLTSGVKKGVEKVCSVLLPILLVILIILTIYANTLPGASAGLSWYLKPDFSQITFSTIQAAVVQAFFSIGVGMCCAFVYGSYSATNENLVQSLSITALMDTFAAVLSGLLCVPALFAFQIEPTAGPSLIFVTLPQLFNRMGVIGRIFGLLFMICVFFAGFTSMLGSAEACVACLIDTKKLSRKKASWIIVIILLVLNVITLSSFIGGPFASFKCLGLDYFDFNDFLSSGVGLSLGAVLMTAFVIFKWGFGIFQEKANQGAEQNTIRIHRWMKGYFIIVLPVLLLFSAYCIIRVYI